MSDVPTNSKRWLWPLRSRKVQVALATLVLAYANQLFGVELSANVVLTVLGTGVALILGIAHEDNGAKTAPTINTGFLPEVRVDVEHASEDEQTKD